MLLNSAAGHLDLHGFLQQGNLPLMIQIMLNDAKQKEVMRVQIRKRISQVLETEELAGVYYTDFVLQ